jgi:hypothetical protein
MNLINAYRDNYHPSVKFLLKGYRTAHPFCEARPKRMLSGKASF